MKRRSVKSFFLIFLLLSLVWAPAPLIAGDQTARVVWHVDFSDPRRFSAMLTSINNMAVLYESELMEHDIRIVALSHGIRFLTDDPLTGTPFVEDEVLAAERDNLRGRLMTLMSMHDVKVELCDITRTAVGLDAGIFYDGIEIVPSGVVRIADLQSNHGFAYLKAE